jgi:peptide/nickel transport system substrate-binding protein
MRVLFWIFFLITIVSCAEKSNYNPNTFKFNLSVGLNSIDPAFSKDLASVWASSLIYESLFEFDQNNILKPVLVKSYSVSNNGLTYHFQLKNDVFFHKNKCFGNVNSTRKLCSEDVLYSYKRLLDTSTLSPGSWVLREHLDNIKPFRMIDSLTFEIKLKNPSPKFLQKLAMTYTAIVPKEAVIFYGSNFDRNPVGTGAFQFQFWKRGEVLFMRRNPHYYQKDSTGKSLPYIDYIKVSFNENKKTELLSLINGELSMINGIDPSTLEKMIDNEGHLKSKYSRQLELIKRPYLNTEYLAILSDKELLEPNSPLLIKEVRQAIHCAINKVKLSKTLRKNLVIPAIHGFVPNGIVETAELPIQNVYSPEKARELLKKAGYTKENPPKIALNINNANIDLAEYISHALESVGFQIEIKLHPTDKLNQMSVKSQVDFFRKTWIADYPDAENYIVCLYSKSSTPPNYSRYKNSELDQLYLKLRSENIDSKRVAALTKIEEILRTDCPIIPLFYEQSLRLKQKNIIGLEQNGLNHLSLKKVKIIN